MADVDRSKAKGPFPVSAQYGLIEEAPETAVDVRGAEPSSVLAIGPCGYQCWEVTKPRPFIDLMLKPTRIEARLLGVG